LHDLICKSTARRAMNIIDSVLCSDVIEDAKLDGGLTKVRDKLKSVYGKMDNEDIVVYDDAFYEDLEKNNDLYDDDFYAKLENGELDDDYLAYGVDGDEGLPGIPVLG